MLGLNFQPLATFLGDRSNTPCTFQMVVALNLPVRGDVTRGPLFLFELSFIKVIV
jgi:hypothetical protein